MATELKLFIAGEWTEGTGDDHYEVKSPVTGEHIYNVPKASQDDIDRAVAAAREATHEMRHWTAFERADLCLRIYELWQDKVEEVAKILTLEQGKPFHEESLDDIEESGDYFQIAAEDVKRLAGEVIPTTERNRRMFTVHRPVGVWAAVTPWNFPVMIPMEYVGPGLATGNSVIVKPPEFTTWALLEMAKVFEEAGVPKGAVSIIPGAGDIGEALVTHDGIDAIGFTGSSATGARIVSQMGLKRSIMEMSGNGPTIVTSDADIEKAAEAAVYGTYYNAGQVCVATERLIVLDDVHDDFVAATMEAAKEVRLGDPFNESTNMGPLNNEATARKMDPPHRGRRRAGRQRAHRRRARRRPPHRPVLRVHGDRSRPRRLAGLTGGVIWAGAPHPHRERRSRRCWCGQQDQARSSGGCIHQRSDQGLLLRRPNQVGHGDRQRLH